MLSNGFTLLVGCIKATLPTGLIGLIQAIDSFKTIHMYIHVLLTVNIFIIVHFTINLVTK